MDTNQQIALAMAIAALAVKVRPKMDGKTAQEPPAGGSYSFHRFDINTWEVFHSEFIFWFSPVEYRYPKYSIQVAEDLERLIIQNFLSGNPNKIKQSAEYNQFLDHRKFSWVKNDWKPLPSPFQFDDEPAKEISNDQHEAIKLYSRLSAWTEDFLLERKHYQDDFFLWIFALSLRQRNISDIYDFLDYQLISNFNSERRIFLRFLKPLVNNFSEELFYQAHVDTVRDWIKMTEFEMYKAISTKDSSPDSFGRQNITNPNSESVFVKRQICSYELSKPEYENHLPDILNSLKRSKLIDKSTILANFKRVFKGEQIVSPVIWTGSVEELAYFVKVIHSERKIIKKRYHSIWKVTAICFAPSVGKYDWRIFSSQHKPARADIIERICNNF